MTGGEIPTTTTVTDTIESTLGKEAYRIYIKADGIFLEGGSRIGIRYAKSTFEQLRLQYPEKLPCMEIEDAPSSAYRSFHLYCISSGLCETFYPGLGIEKDDCHVRTF